MSLVSAPRPPLAAAPAGGTKQSLDGPAGLLALMAWLPRGLRVSAAPVRTTASILERGMRDRMAALLRIGPLGGRPVAGNTAMRAAERKAIRRRIPGIQGNPSGYVAVCVRLPSA